MIANKRQGGFTIVELMIATLVFSVVLLVITGSMVQIGRMYYKGITSARTQEVTRSIMSGVTQELQFSNDGVWPTTTSGASEGYCLGDRLYSFQFGQQVSQGQHALVSRTVNGGCRLNAPTDLEGALDPADRELLGENMRLANFEIQPRGTNSYEVTVRVVYGPNALLCSTTTVTDSCNPDATDLQDPEINNARDLRCKNVRTGSEFCAASELKTVIERRLQ